LTINGFRHEALLYGSEEQFVEKTGAFLQEGLDAGEAILVVVGSRKIHLLREYLGATASRVLFADMAEVGRNPARIIPAWRAFVATNAATGTRMRGIGEPIDASRSADALVECERHESLLNLAFAGSPAWTLLCPYDTAALSPAVIEETLRNHPYVRNGDSKPNPRFRGIDDCASPIDQPLPDPPPHAATFHVDLGTLARLRELVASVASKHGFGGREVDDFVLTVHELATNSIRHGGGRGLVRLWGDDGEIVADVRDRGRILDPLAGRVEPRLDVASGRGLWLANQLSDLVQIRVQPNGGAVRARLRRR
jgi:anti-sigma regulatory factor (Ser/Thr protein kinase)